jgi:hypothetical protein
MGIPDAVEARVATLTNMPSIPPGAPGMAPGALSPLAIPPQVGTTQGRIEQHGDLGFG